MTLDDILLPQTPAHIRHNYETLGKRAKETTFGLLEQDIVMLDTETTGLSFRNNELIEIAAARLSGREVTERFQTFVHPTGPIPAEIVKLTGIRDVDVTNAPSPEEAIERLSEFVAGQPIVAHNASFDRTFIQGVPGGSEVTDTWVDSLALSRIALPRLSSHRLSDMAEAFGCASVTHRAMDDVDALCGMWRILLLGLSDMPSGLMNRLASMHKDNYWQFRPIFSALALYDANARLSLQGIRHDLGTLRDGQRRVDVLEEGVACYVPTVEQIDEAFSSGGMVSSMYDAYEERSEQLLMAQEVRESLETSSHRCIEAGTGVGKSMAYLVPELLFAKANHVTVGVATKTNALTDQLIAHELPALNTKLPGGITFTSLKGFEHYPCMRSLELATRAELPVNTADEEAVDNALTAIAVTYAFSCQSIDGDLDALGIRWRFVPRSLLTTSANECLRRSCPYYPNGCFVHGARNTAACSDVVVTNHALLLCDVESDNAILPPIRHWVIDEAHSFEEEARRQWECDITAEEVSNVLMRLGSMDHGLIQGILAQSSRLSGSKLIAGLMSKVSSWVNRLSDANIELFEAVHGLLGTTGFGGYDSTTIWIGKDLRNTGEWSEVDRAARNVIPLLDETIKSLDDAREALKPEDAQLASELVDPTRRLREFREAIRIVVLEPDEKYVCSAVLHKGKRRINDCLTAQYIDVGPELAKKWYPETRSVVFSSATMAVGPSFEHFEQAVGLNLLPEGSHSSKQLESSFDFDGNMAAIVARDLPAPTDRRYLQELEDMLFGVHKAMGGSVLTLFTNRREMERVYSNLKPRLATLGLDLLCQQRGSSPRRLREQFMADESVSLLALKSFWEGFDAPGNTLRCVVVCRLPFANPNDPLACERSARDRNSWWNYALPDAVLEVKQAAGRLIRTKTDTGVFILADSRVATKRYGSMFTRALPSHNCITLERANIERYLTLWRASHE